MQSYRHHGCGNSPLFSCPLAVSSIHAVCYRGGSFGSSTFCDVVLFCILLSFCWLSMSRCFGVCCCCFVVIVRHLVVPFVSCHVILGPLARNPFAVLCICCCLLFLGPCHVQYVGLTAADSLRTTNHKLTQTSLSFLGFKRIAALIGTSTWWDFSW